MPDRRPSANNNSDNPFGGPSCQLLYANLPPEVNSRNICDGPGFYVLWDVIHRFEALADLMPLRSESLKDWGQALQAQWSGDSATRMAETAKKFQLWLDVFSLEATHAALKVRDIVRAYQEAYRAMRSPVEVADNRNQRETLVAEQGSGLARHDEAIAALDREYEMFWAEDVEVMCRYEERVREALAAMPSWPEPPPADPVLARIHVRGG
nr:PPE domain-containing protein [Mycobacterium haemophilum]